MIAAGMIHLAIIFAAEMFAAAVRRCKWFSEIGSPQVEMAFFFGLEPKLFPTFYSENVKRKRGE